ncbi:MAG: VacJ family lipoprotein [Hyphomonas sp. BRH_c22]|uniref:MlaA family lipoprotein n=1 Tax=Hyphomonas sp. BRH_c22 TaxID=1629710 RepID=UPI0005F1E439|nr:VacJ family lipoprotein [Hyphomonas sp. BRH_c22]KJS38316.1 MAG: VacJ family lipoprotein [Hyphomonas sp. BRH_c22]
MKRFVVAAYASLAISACATAPDSSGGNVADPYQGFNRQMFAFNQGVDKYALGPAASAYKTLTPAVARDRVDDFLGNLSGPVIFANDILQAEASRAGTTAARFTINSTIGLLGIWDAAEHFGIDGHSEDFGQTLAVWGVDSGPYLVLPLLGPSTPRDLLGIGVDQALDPLTWVEIDNDADTDLAVRSGLAVIGLLNARAGLDDQIDALNAQPEPYVALRRIWSSQRQAEIANGEIDDDAAYDDLPEFDEFEE